MDGPFETTFGIELEFLVLYKTGDYLEACDKAYGLHRHSEGEFERVLVQHIVDVLRASNFAVNNPYVDHIDNWTVSSDSTVEVEQEDLPQHLQESDSYAVELKSPAYRYTTEALIEVQRAVNVIKREFKVFVNETCGFHVHVGNHDRGFTLETVKNFSLLVTVFERQINQLHPRHRNTNCWCQTPALQLPGRNLWEVVEAIEAMPDIANMISLMCSDGAFVAGSKYRAYNLCNLTDDNLRTIEFRQHQGTMDADAILAWVSLTCRLVSASHDAGPAGFIELVKELADKPNFTVIDLLHNFGFEDLVRFYFIRYYSARSVSHWRLRGLWVDPSTGEWLSLPDRDESSSENTDSNDGDGGSQDRSSYLNQLYSMLNWNGGEVSNDDVQFISETFWKDI